MQIKVNGSPLDITQGNYLIVVIDELRLRERNGIAVAVNSAVVPKKRWEHFELHDHDEVIIIEAAQGG